MSSKDAFLSSLTPGERIIVEQVAFGGTNEEIATVLFRSVSVVKFHLSNAFKKLDLDTRTQLVAEYWQSVLRDAEADRDHALAELEKATA